jgi:hypothetical protein
MKSVPPPRTDEEFFLRTDEYQTDWEDMLRVLKRMRADDLSLRKASTHEGVDPRKVRRLGRQALKKRKNRSLYATRKDSLLRVMRVLTPAGQQDVAIRDSQQASRLGEYWASIQTYGQTGRSSGLKRFAGKQIKDISGVSYPLITDLGQLKRLGSAGVLSFEQLYVRST